MSDAESVDISCTYSGTNDPDTVQWKVDGIVKTSDDTGYEVTTEAFEETASKDRYGIISISYIHLISTSLMYFFYPNVLYLSVIFISYICYSV